MDLAYTKIASSCCIIETVDMNDTGRESGRRRLSSTRTYSAEDQALNTIAKEAEQRLAIKRAARAEAREMRMKEIEKQQKEAENEERQSGDLPDGKVAPRNILPTRQTSYQQFSARRASEDTPSSLDKDLKIQFAELDDKCKKAMLTNAQLDNEKQMYKYQVENLKDTIDDLEEFSSETHRQYKEKCRECESEKRLKKEFEKDVTCLKDQIRKRDALIEEHGLVLVGRDEVETKDGIKLVSQATLLSSDTVKFLGDAGEGSLDERLKVFVEEKKQLEEEVRRLRQELEESRDKQSLAQKYGNAPDNSPKMNGPDVQEIQREASRQVNDYAFKLTKAEQDISSLEGNVTRLESQVKRYKTAAENAEIIEEDLKSEKRKLAKELRESQTLIEELQSQNGHLQKRLEKLKSSRNALLK